MKKTLSLAAATVALAAACGLCIAMPAQAADTTALDTTVASRLLQSNFSTSDLDPQHQAIVDRILAQLPADWETRLDAARAKYGLNESQWPEIRDSAINPGDYQCQPTDLSRYANSLLADVQDPITVLILSLFGGFDLPTYDALIFGKESSSNTFGAQGEYTQQLNSEMKNLRRFWDIDSAGIELVPMHGADVFSDRDRMSRTLAVLYGGTPEDNLGLADLFIELVDSEPSLKGGANPIFTFNAFAYSEKGDPQPLGISDRIIMGDGILQGMTAVNLGDVAPRGILGHEFSHHVQYQKNLFDSPLTGPEATRRTELMADAFGTYYLTHSRGEALNAARVLKSEKSFYEVGDCSFSSSGHHGTPNQRLNSSTWAAGVANEEPNQGHILPALTLDQMFEAKLPDLVKPDAG
ncbi:hypothetical protein [Streptomyces brasiliensis]|uniref:Uncharacterized protein n=1 Tax=Streptomyces brasiliensis TaxID=1954 RepID=A0A917P3W5_9ACTN|nr:hypothetical protein [Streptomyces brasiliensis]GGJ60373.1 hypothetical protein GCM10010121_083730 [Streptomyces brasiliensis]